MLIKAGGFEFEVTSRSLYAETPWGGGYVVLQKKRPAGPWFENGTEGRNHAWYFGRLEVLFTLGRQPRNLKAA